MKSAKKDHNLKINNNKIFNIKNKLIQSNNHNSNKKAVDKIKNIANDVNKNKYLILDQKKVCKRKKIKILKRENQRKKSKKKI